jgi:hypothetical protein
MNKKFLMSVKNWMRSAMLMTVIVAANENQASAQSFKSHFIPYSTAGIGVGTASYYGDMAGYSRPFASTFRMARWNVTGNYTYHFSPRFAARAAFSWARLAGDDYNMHIKGPRNLPGSLRRNLHFRNDVKEFSAVGILKLVPDNRTSDRRAVLSPYLFAGIGLIAHNPMARTPAELIGGGDNTIGAYKQGDWVKLKPLGTEGQGNPGYEEHYSLVNLAIPFGFGLRYKINDRLDISGELGFRFTTTDYLDDIKGNYADPSVLTPLAQMMANRSQEAVTARKLKDRAEYISNNSGVPGTQRGGPPTRKDTYLLGTISIHYVIGSSVKCPPIRY